MISNITAIGVSNYFLGPRDTELFACDLTERISWLAEEIRRNQQPGRDLDEDLVAEHEQLVAFRDEAERVTGKDFGDVTIVPEDSFADHARGHAEELADIDFIAPFVDWEKFARSLRQDYRALPFGDDTVFVR
jgi:hypothetical protein